MVAVAAHLIRRPAPAHDDIEADRQFDGDVAVLGSARNLRRPRLPTPLGKRRPAKMVDHDLELRQALRQLEHGFELRRIDGYGIEGKPRRSEELLGFDHAVLQQPAWIRLVADKMAHADELPAGAQPLKRPRRCVGVSKRQPANHAANELDLVAEIETLLGLPADLMQHLHQHRSLDAAAVELRTQVVGREIARQAITDLIRPRIGVPPPPPEMMMRIDHGLIRSGSRRPATILALFPRPSAAPIAVAETPQFNRVCAA